MDVVVVVVLVKGAICTGTVGAADSGASVEVSTYMKLVSSIFLFFF